MKSLEVNRNSNSPGLVHICSEFWARLNHSAWTLLTRKCYSSDGANTDSTGRKVIFVFCFKIKLGLLTLLLSCLHIFTSTKVHIHQWFLVMIWKARDIGFVVLTVPPVLAWWLWACFGCAFLYLLGAVKTLLLHPVPPLWTLRSTLPVLHFLVWVSYGAAHRYLSCANPGAVNTHCSPKTFYLAALSGVPMLIFPFSLHLCQLQVYYSSL